MTILGLAIFALLGLGAFAPELTGEHIAKVVKSYRQAMAK